MAGLQGDQRFSGLATALDDHAASAHPLLRMRSGRRKKKIALGVLREYPEAAGRPQLESECRRQTRGLCAPADWLRYLSSRGQHAGSLVLPHELVSDAPTPQVGFKPATLRLTVRFEPISELLAVTISY